MTKEVKADCSCVIDTSGLHAIANSSGNLKATLFARLENGTIGVPTWAWQEFRNLYEDEAAELSPHVAKRLQFNKQVDVGAARIAEESELGFSLGAYDNHVELFCASIALNKNYTVLTSSDNLSAYENMGCDAKDLEDWIED